LLSQIDPRKEENGRKKLYFNKIGTYVKNNVCKRTRNGQRFLFCRTISSRISANHDFIFLISILPSKLDQRERRKERGERREERERHTHSHSAEGEGRKTVKHRFNDNTMRGGSLFKCFRGLIIEVPVSPPTNAPNAPPGIGAG